MNAAKITPLHPHLQPTLLVVEDDVITRFAVADELRAAGYRVLEASSAEEAIAVLERLPVHLLFIDLHMPGAQSGLDVARVAQGCRPAPKIVLTSGKEPPDRAPEYRDLGPFIPKPYLMSRVLETVRRSLDPTLD